MPVKTHAHIRPEAPQDAADAFSRARLLDVSQGYSDWHVGSEGSHAVSRSGEALENRIAGVKFGLLNSSSQALVALQELISNPTNLFQHVPYQILGTHVEQQSAEESASAWLVDERYAALIHEIIQNYKFFLLQAQENLTQPLFAEVHEPVRLENELRAAFEAEPLEDGMSHPAELVIEKALRSTESAFVLDWLKSLCLDVERPAFSASVLQCLGRQTVPGTSKWRAELVRGALGLDNIEIRDAAVQAAELWDDENLADVLRSHDEAKPWLREYIEEILENWSD